MENLSYPVMKLLINNLAVTDFGYYEETNPETGATVKNLLIKKLGLAIPYVAANVNIKNSVTKDGALKSVLLQFNGPAPCNDCNYEYGIEIIRRRQQPGVLNDDYYPKGRFYGGVIQALQTTSGGQVADSDKLIMEDQILTDMHADQASDISTREPSIAKSKRLYIVTVNNAATDQLTYTIAGTAATFAGMSTTVVASVAALNADATFKASLVAIPISATKIAITSIVDGLIFYLADGGGATTPTLARYMWVYAKNTNVQFEVRYDKDFITLTRFGLTILANTATGGGTIYMKLGNVSNTITTAQSSTTLAANITASTSGAAGYVYATAATSGNNKAIYVYSGIYEPKWILDAYTTITTAYSGAGQWPSLTGEDVFRIFMGERHLGDKSVYVYLDQADPTAKYNKLDFVVTRNTRAIHGASHMDHYEQRVEVFIKQGLGATNIWDASGYMWESISDDSMFTPDKTINDLIDHWSSLTHVTDYVAII